jgi:hypothetical protein
MEFRPLAKAFGVTIVLLATAGVAPIAVGVAASSSTQRAVANRKTIIYDAGGRSIGSITGDGANYWVRGASGECWVLAKRSKSGTVFYAGQTHNFDGGAVPAGPRKWNVWFRGTTLSGIIVLRSAIRADLLTRSGKKIGYTRGHDPVAAGAAFLILDREGCNS